MHPQINTCTQKHSHTHTRIHISSGWDLSVIWRAFFINENGHKMSEYSDLSERFRTGTSHANL